MDLKEIISVSGKSGLFKIIAHTKNGLIVESLLDGKRMPVYASDKISNLEDIYIYTTETEKPLKEVLKLIYDKEKGSKSIDHKQDDKTLRNYFEQVLPDYDKDRVYISDIRKVINWYNLLLEKNILDFSEEEKEKTTTEVEEKIENNTETDLKSQEDIKTEETPAPKAKSKATKSKKSDTK